jgi:HD-GYP domain-containing protein (c-di-GMP phosphodiesterase class II)
MLHPYSRARSPVHGAREKRLGKSREQACVFLLVSAACLAAGLWMQHHLVSLATLHANEQEAWQGLEQAANAHSRKLDDLLDAAIGQREQPSVPLHALNPLRNDTGSTVLFVDSDWTLMAAVRGDDAASGSRTGEATPVNWTPERQTVDASDGIGPAIRGRVDWDGHRHLAVALPLRHHDGYCLLCVDEAQLTHAQSLLTSAMIPISGLTLLWTSLLMGIAAYLILSPSKDPASQDRSRTTADNLRQTQELIRTRDTVVFGLAKLADSRDGDTGHHLERISLYCRTLALAMCEDPRFSGKIKPSFVRLIGISSALHDIGKVGIEDAILRKPGHLSAPERKRMEQHTTIGEECIREIELRLGGSNFLEMAREIAAAHHERWDGTGYPHGLKGEGIPLAARVVAIADVYDALVSRRVYKPAQDHESCRESILSEAGKQFDPTLLEVWLTVEDRFHQIARRFGSATGAEKTPGFSVVELEEEPKNNLCGVSAAHGNDAVTSPVEV